MSIDLEIARRHTLQPIADIAAPLGLPAEVLEPYGRHIAKLSNAALRGLQARADGKLILVTAVSPTPAGEGKTTTTIGLGDALNRIGRRAVIALREPSLGPVFGRKGGATGGGHAQVAPMEQINLHFTGDFHAITAAHNLLAALIDNQLYWGEGVGLDPRRVSWRRVTDTNDRALRQIAASLGGGVNGAPRETGFDITVASEVMAVLCLARDLDDLQHRLARMWIGRTRIGAPVTAGDLGAAGAMSVLLAEAILPNLVQTLEGSPALIHGGPFANIAHGCNSVIATRAALRLGEFAVTEAGFGADLGAEKFFDIKCRAAGLAPAAVVIVATVRALKMQGGVAQADLGVENVPALRAGLANLGRHIENVSRFGPPVAVAINAFAGDTAAEHDAVVQYCRDAHGVEAHLCSHWAHGAAGGGRAGAACGGVGGCSGDAGRLSAVPRRHAPAGEDPHRGARDLPRRRRTVRTRGGAGSRPLRRARGRPPARVHGQDTLQLHRRRERAGRAHRLRAAGARGSHVGGRGVRGRALRGGEHHARPASPSRGDAHPHGRRADRGAELTVFAPPPHTPAAELQGRPPKRDD
jgi:formate--tetrahydrofolate ligase